MKMTIDVNVESPTFVLIKCLKTLNQQVTAI